MQFYPLRFYTSILLFVLVIPVKLVSEYLYPQPVIVLNYTTIYVPSIAIIMCIVFAVSFFIACLNVEVWDCPIFR
jgi:hypothetical protein